MEDEEILPFIGMSTLVRHDVRRHGMSELLT